MSFDYCNSIDPTNSSVCIVDPIIHKGFSPKLECDDCCYTSFVNSMCETKQSANDDESMSTLKGSTIDSTRSVYIKYVRPSSKLSTDSHEPYGSFYTPNEPIVHKPRESLLSKPHFCVPRVLRATRTDLLFTSFHDSKPGKYRKQMQLAKVDEDAVRRMFNLHDYRKRLRAGLLLDNYRTMKGCDCPEIKHPINKPKRRRNRSINRLDIAHASCMGRFSQYN